MPRTPLAALDHIAGSLRRIDGWVARLDYATFASDDMARLAVERCLEIVSEASRRIPDADKARFPDVPWRKIAGIGNILRHDYDDIAPKIVWATVTGELSSLRRAVDMLIAERGG